ncbi:hypothetical protein Lal_00042916 [Lupinus albus]|nr:hypothetical protein Lal_00042916 [Lupinus albus]
MKRFQRKGKRDSTKKGKNPKDWLTCNECGKEGHMKFQCPSHLKKVENNKKNSWDFKSKKSHIVWDVPEEDSTSSTSEEEKSTKLCLMVNNQDPCNSRELERSLSLLLDSRSSEKSAPERER